MTNKRNSYSKKAIKAISSQTLVTVILGIVEIITFSIMSRILSKEDFGYYAAISAVIVVFASFSETGIGAAIIQKDHIDKRYVNNAFTLSLIFGTIIMCMLFLSSGFISGIVANDNMKVPLMLMSITLLLNCLISVNVSIMYRNMRFLTVGFIHLFSLILTSSIAIFLAFEGFGYYAIIVKAILTSVCTFVISFILCKTKFSFMLDKKTVKSIFNFSGWLMASVVFRNFAQQIDRLLMPNLLSVTLLGAYNRPKDFINQISSKINGIFDIALFPVLSSIQNDSKLLASAFRRSFYLLNLTSTLLGLLFIINSDLIIRIFFGDEWISLRTILCVFSISVIFNADGRLADCYLRSLALTRQQFVFRVVETLVKLVCVLIGYRWGMIGVAASIVFADAIIKIVKISFVAYRVNICYKTLVEDFIISLRFLILFLPFNIFSLWFFPQTWEGDLFIFVVFALTTILVFGMLPKVVGKRYYDEIWLKGISALR